MGILFLCTGNTCRSPLAEAFARLLFGSAEISFESAGLVAHPGQPASDGSVRAAAEHGIDLRGHRSRLLSRSTLASADWVIAMTADHLVTFKERFADYAGRLGLIGEPGVDFRHIPPASGSTEVVDPFGGSFAEYRAMATQLGDLLARWRWVFESPGGSVMTEVMPGKIAIGGDHRGVGHKSELVQVLQEAGFDCLDFGHSGPGPADYPDAAFAVGEAVATGKCDRGILICGSGIGMSISANKVPGVRASLCHDSNAAQMTRRHNDSNVLCLAADLVTRAEARRIVFVWLGTPFEGGRHARRVAKITRYEEKFRDTGPGGAGQVDPAPEGDSS